MSRVLGAVLHNGNIITVRSSEQTVAQVYEYLDANGLDGVPPAVRNTIRELFIAIGTPQSYEVIVTIDVARFL